jgi:hypothetical protein
MFEDDDFSLRIRRAGYRVIAADDTFIHHFGNGSFAKIPNEESLRIFEQNKKVFETKWQTEWQPHKLRPGVRSPFEEVRHSVADFLRVEKVTDAGDRRKLKLQKLHPGFCTTRQGFNIQSDGQSALVVECEHATPGTVIVWGGTMLTTSYGNPALLSALVPADLYAAAGSVEVHLLNDFGQSNRLEFVVEAPKASLVIA